MVLPAPLPASCLKLTCSSAEWLARFWHLKDGVNLHSVASQVPSETKDLWGFHPSSDCPQVWILMNIECIQLEFTGCRVLGAAFSRTPRLPKGKCRCSELQQPKPPAALVGLWLVKMGHPSACFFVAV